MNKYTSHNLFYIGTCLNFQFYQDKCQLLFLTDIGLEEVVVNKSGEEIIRQPIKIDIIENTNFIKHSCFNLLKSFHYHNLFEQLRYEKYSDFLLLRGYEEIVRWTDDNITPELRREIVRLFDLLHIEPLN